MDEPRTIPPRPRDRLYAVLTLVPAVVLLPVALVRHPGVGYVIENEDQM
ncbi:hypothetical protein ACIBQ1_48465 [Nonomuraea sp. NPDC050153]